MAKKKENDSSHTYTPLALPPLQAAACTNKIQINIKTTKFPRIGIFYCMLHIGRNKWHAYVVFFFAVWRIAY